MKSKKNNLNVSIMIASAIFVEILVFFAFFNYGKFSYSYIPEESTKFGGELEVADTNIGKRIILDNEITKGNGLNKIDNNYIFRGDVKNNYLEFNNLTWRIIEVSGDKLQYVTIPVGYQHCINNVGDEELVMILWANELFDKDKPDTFVMEEDKNVKTKKL